MAAAGGSKGPPTMAGRTRSFAELVSAPPQPIPEVVVPLRSPQIVDGEVCVQFSRDELERSAAPFRFAMVMKFLKHRPSLDRIRAFIHGRWGLVTQPVVSAMRKPRNVFVRFSAEADFIKALSRESSEIDGVNYRNFKWTVDFSEEVEPVLAPVWITLPGLAPNFYQESYLRNIIAPVGVLLRRDNATKCATRTDGARVCVLMDISQKPVQYVWIGLPHQPSSVCQEIIYETLPAFCTKCSTQGHNLGTCKLLVKDMGKKKESGLVWKPQNLKKTEKLAVLGGNRPSISGEPVGAELAVKDSTLEATNSRVNKEDSVMESEKIGTYCGDEGLVRSDDGLSKDQLTSMEKHIKGSTEMRGDDSIKEGDALEDKTNMNCTINAVEMGGVSGNSEGDDLMSGEKMCDPIFINGSMEGFILEKLDDNVEELNEDNIGWRRVEKVTQPVMESSGTFSDSEGIGDLPHLAKEKDGVSDTEILKPKMRCSMKLRSSSQAPSRPERLDQC
ncbi:hypothetical protein SLA2020_277800 [Shorea laevis]